MERNIAVIGCGYWGKNLVRNFAELGALHTICDVDPQKLETFESLYPWANTQSDYLQVLQNEEVKGIVIATPAVLHYPMAKEALLAGKDTFVERSHDSKKIADNILQLLSGNTEGLPWYDPKAS